MVANCRNEFWSDICQYKRAMYADCPKVFWSDTCQCKRGIYIWSPIVPNCSGVILTSTAEVSYRHLLSQKGLGQYLYRIQRRYYMVACCSKMFWRDTCQYRGGIIWLSICVISIRPFAARWWSI